MNVAELLKYIGILRSKSENNKLIAFVGAGVSRNVSGMPSWYDLIKAMADAIGYSKCNTCKHKTDQCEGDCKFKSE